jgi:hypothetical protein
LVDNRNSLEENVMFSKIVVKHPSSAKSIDHFPNMKRKNVSKIHLWSDGRVQGPYLGKQQYPFNTRKLLAAAINEKVVPSSPNQNTWALEHYLFVDVAK